MRSGLVPRLLSYQRRAAIAFTGLVAVVAMAGLASSAQAATYTVGTHEDLTGTCEAPASGTCSLRQLIEYEDVRSEMPSQPDVIVVPSGKYELIHGTLTITQSLVIVGAGARTTTVEMPSSVRERVFSAQSPAESAIGISGLEIAGGVAEADENSYSDFGGDVRNTGSLLLSEDWITEGTASGGAGIANDAGTLVLERSLVSGNHASTGSKEAGGIQNYGSATYDGTISPGKKAVLAVEDSTVADNEATLGAGIFSLTEDGVPDENGVSIIDSTIAYNNTQGELGAGLLAYDGTIAVDGSIVAYNSATTSGKVTYSNCLATSPATIVSPLGYDLETGTDCGFTSIGDLQNTSPDFSSSTPQNNGGNTNTFALEPTSPAVDAIPASVSLLCENLDQRDITRPQGSACDIGAFELAPSTFQAAGVPVSATAGAQFNGTVATFTEALPDTVASDYAATINWGDGTSTTAGTVSASGGGFAVSGSHTYASGGTYATSVKITDVQGASATATSTATVAAAHSPAPPTLVATSPPTVLTTTSAAFTTTVNPDGLETEVHFEYGPVLGGASAASTGGITYGSVTPDQSVGAGFSNQTVTATVAGLLPNVTYNVRAVATNSAGSATGTNQTLVTPADPPPPPPVLGKAVNVTPVSGIVYIKLPPGATLASAASVSPFSSFSMGAQALEALTKGQAFIPLTEARQIPVGSVLETTGGVVGITTATTASRKGKLQSGDFGAGIFKLLQGRRQKGLTELNIIDNHSASQVCATVGKKGKALAAKHLSSKTLGRVNASAHGRFSVRGQYSAATVRGTVWNVSNRCEGTLTHVTRGVVSVRDFRRRKTITLFTGESYLARVPRP
jgi:hypothetical protein